MHWGTVTGRFKLGRVASGLLGAQVVLAGGALVVNVLSARALGPSARGELALFLQIAYAANLLCLLGRHKAYLRIQSDDSSLASAYRDMSLLSHVPYVLSLALSIGVGFGFGFGWGILFLAGAFFIKSSAGILVNTHRAAAIVARRTGPFFGATIATQVTLVGGASLMSLGGFDRAEFWLLLYGLSAAVPYLFVEFLIRRSERARPREHDLKRVKSLGLYLTPSSVAEAVVARADRFILPALSSFAQLGLYAVVATMTELISWPVRQYTDSRVPKWTSEFEAGILRLREALLPVLFLSSLSAVVVAGLTYATLVPLFGSQYESAVALVLPLSISATLYSISIFGVGFAIAAGDSRAANLITICGVIVAIPLYVVWIPDHGALGAAWASAIAYAVSAAATMLIGPIITARQRK